MTYRSDLDALEARHASLEADAGAAIKSRDAAKRMLDEARAKTRLPVLDNIRVAAPCNADWNDMTGDDRVRHCGSCSKKVYNLSDMATKHRRCSSSARASCACATTSATTARS